MCHSNSLGLQLKNHLAIIKVNADISHSKALGEKKNYFIINLKYFYQKHLNVFFITHDNFMINGDWMKSIPNQFNTEILSTKIWHMYNIN